MEVCVYIIWTYKGTFYTGITNSIIRRWEEHKKSKYNYMGTYGPRMVVYQGWCAGYAEARRKEVYIQRKGAFKFICDLYFSGVDTSPYLLIQL